MFLIAGLGNPGKKYQYTRHNVGFMIIDEFAANFQFTDFSFQPIFNSQICKGKIANKKTILVKPQVFMNLSGKTLRQLVIKLNLEIENLIVIHDDIDISFSTIKIVKNRGAAGHKGVQSIINELKTKNFIRVRVGICPKERKPRNPEKFVLQKFGKEEEKIMKEAVKKILKAIELIMSHGIEEAQRIYN